MREIDFLGLKVSAISKGEIIAKILEFALVPKRKMIGYLNAHCVNLSLLDSEYRQILRKMDLVYAGGKGVVWASRLFESSLPERVNILDFFNDLSERLRDEEIKIYLLGGEPSIVEKAAKRLIKEPFGLKIVGFHHGFFNEAEEGAIINEINAVRPNLVIVGMGVPKQEKWIYRHLNELEVNLCWAVGAAFELLSGCRKRAPEWMIGCGFEWLYRLCQEPKRLWKRYLTGNFIFIYHIVRRRIIYGRHN